MGEEPTGAAHEDDQDSQNQSGDYNRYANLQFRPFQLLLARQLSSQAEWRQRLSVPLTTGYWPPDFSDDSRTQNALSRKRHRPKLATQ
jgi:hypothetical protein